MFTIRKHTVICVHGMWGCSKQFEHIKNYFDALDYTVIVLDLEGSSFEGYVDQVRHEVRCLSGCILVGHSMGGLIVQQVANLEPTRIKGVVLINSAAHKGVPALTLRLLFTMLRPRYVWAMITNGLYKIHPDDARSLMMNGVNADHNLEKVFPKQESGFLTMRLAFSLIELQRPILCPVLAISGLKDLMTPPKSQDWSVGPRTFMRIWINSGHMPMLDKEGCKTLCEVIEEFLHDYGSQKNYWKSRPIQQVSKSTKN